MISTENLLLACSSILILIHFLQTSQASLFNPTYCAASACGIIDNISFPFRLKDDPKQCGDRDYELVCEDNVTSVYLNSQKYHVKAINYERNTIRLADASINNNICSFPRYYVSRKNFTYQYPYRISSNFISNQDEVAWPINFLSCQYPLKNSSFFTETTHCAQGDNLFNASNSSNGNGRHTYVKVGHMNASDVNHMCRVDNITLTSWKFKDLKNVSVSEIHDSLLYGFDLSWSPFKCIQCNGGLECTSAEEQLVRCSSDEFYIKLQMKWGDVLILLLLLVFLLTGHGATIFILFACIWILFIYSNREWFFNSVKGTLLNILALIGVSVALRFIILFPCGVGFLIYKFRRRHLSMFDVIEGFLQGDNKLIPIRYSYSDIKKMTRGFREKLGEGGYGSVYKGKLRSGHYVAVKLLGKPSANGQDFINEIATIGRIHHVNVVKLVGYCAERSKRALVFDFMPNGSLEKYIYSSEKMNSLNWERKYEIAIGVARGIEYLHRGCDIQILHFDIKPQNILLDDKFIPKISDFGLAKFCSTEKRTVTLTAARGTIGYVAPELINRGIGGVSYKADVYSFGMLLIEMVDLKKDLIGNNEASSQYFPYWIYDCFNQGKDIEIGKVDEIDDDNDNDITRKIARKMTIVALWCIQMTPGDRPSMNKVLEMLEGEVEHLQIPPRPSQAPQVAGNEDQTWSTFSTDSISLLSHDAAPTVEITIEDL